MRALRQLIVNADDFGFTRDVNAGIIEGHRRGIVTSTTLMANGDAFEDAVRLAGENPALGVGCHLVLVGGYSAAQAGRRLPESVAELVRGVLFRRVSVFEELAAQVVRILDAGIRPTHLDTHKHTHLLPPVLDGVARISAEFRIPWVRLPVGIPLLQRRLRRIAERHGSRFADHFAGFRMTGRFGAKDLGRLIRGLPEGTTEFMCHPGHCTGELRQARTRLKESRERELEALTAEETRRAIREAHVRLLNYREL